MLSESTNWRKWFFRQGATYFTVAEKQSCIPYSVGADLKSKTSNKDSTIDPGSSCFKANETGRIEYIQRFLRYNYFRRRKK
jgi:hypothetical protein